MASSTDRHSVPGYGRERTRTRTSASWRTVDIVVASVVAVALGVVMWFWNVYLYSWVSPLFTAAPPLQGAIGALWLLPGVVGALLIRKPGSALYTEVVAAFVSVLLPGGQWAGAITVYYAFFEGLAPELVFLATRYRSFRWPTAMVAGAAAGAAMALLDSIYWIVDFSTTNKLLYGLTAVVTSSVTVGLLGWALVRALARTGVLAPFAAGREQQEV
jgi:energy-coupling factor transport system permease protein